MGFPGIAVGAGAVWAINLDQTISRIDPKTGGSVATVDARASTIAAGDAGVWFVDAERPAVTRIDPRTNRVGQTIFARRHSMSQAKAAHRRRTARPLSWWGNRIAKPAPRSRSTSGTRSPGPTAVPPRTPPTAMDHSFDTGTLQKGQSASHTFTAAGTFAYIYTIHPFMHGTVVVEASSSSTTPTGTAGGGAGSTGSSGVTGSTGSSSTSTPNATATSAVPSLPNTGANLLATLLAAGLLIAAGFALRRYWTGKTPGS